MIGVNFLSVSWNFSADVLLAGGDLGINHIKGHMSLARQHN